MLKIINWLMGLLDNWLDPVPPLADLSSTETLIREGHELTDLDIGALLAERGIQSYDRINPYV